MDSRQLLPQLPPELRHLVYTQTVSDLNCATSTGLDFSTKVYDSSHTRVEIIPVHHGNPALLALQRDHFLEGKEYKHFILKHAVQLRIQVLFKGHTNTFVQEHWDKKMAAHLKNLAKRYPWLRKVANYDIRFLWKPASWAQSKKKRRIGAIATKMVDILTQGTDADQMKKCGVVKADLRVADFVASDHLIKGQVLGLGEFIWELDVGSGKQIRRQIREVGIISDAGEVGQAEELEGHVSSKFKVVPKFTSAKRLDGWEENQGAYSSALRREVGQDRDVIQADIGGVAGLALRTVAEEISSFGKA